MPFAEFKAEMTVNFIGSHRMAYDEGEEFQSKVKPFAPARVVATLIKNPIVRTRIYYIPFSILNAKTRKKGKFDSI